MSNSRLSISSLSYLGHEHNAVGPSEQQDALVDITARSHLARQHAATTLKHTLHPKYIS